MVQKNFGWGVTLTEMIPEDAFAVIPTPGFVEGQVDTAKAEVAYDGYLLMADQFDLNWGDGTKVNVVNRTKHVWEANKGVYVSCPRVAIDASSLEEVNATLADHETWLADHDTRIAALETSQAAQDSAITDLQARVVALETAGAPATAHQAPTPPKPSPVYSKPPPTPVQQVRKK